MASLGRFGERGASGGLWAVVFDCPVMGGRETQSPASRGVVEHCAPRARHGHSPSQRPAHVIPYPGCWAAPAGQAAAAGVGGAVLVLSLSAPPVLPAQTVVSTCRYGDGSCRLSRQCR